MASMITMTAQRRDGSKTPKALRREQLIPGILYGPGFEAMPLQLEQNALLRVLRQAGMSHLIELSIEDGSAGPEVVFVRDIQRHPVTDDVLHVDLYRTQAGQLIRLSIPLVQEGDAPVVEEGAVVNTLLNELEIECLPADVPAAITVDLSRLVEFQSVIRVADLDIPEGVTVLTPMDTDVVRPVAPTMELPEEEEEAVELEEEELVEGAEEALEEGEAPETDETEGAEG